MEFEDNVMMVRIFVVVGAIIAALNWRRLGDDVQTLLKIVGAIFLLSLPIGLIRLNEWAIVSWITLWIAIGATVLTRRDGAPWINYSNAPFFVVSIVSLVVAVR